MTVIARRSAEFAGTRFLKRGANDQVTILFNPFSLHVYISNTDVVKKVKRNYKNM